MSLQQKFATTQGDGVFRLPEVPTKYTDTSFQNSLNANNSKRAVLTKDTTAPTSQIAASNKQANTTIPGK
jgi:hypothetical protein